MNQYQINLSQVILALSDALDLVGVDETNHGKRVGFMAQACSQMLNFSAEEELELLQCGLIHDLGVSSTKIHHCLVDQFEWEGTARHCEVGAYLLNHFPPLSHFTDVVRYHHTKWCDLKNLPLPEKTKAYANLIFLTDRVDMFAVPYYGTELLVSIDLIHKKIKPYRGTHFKEEYVDAFLEASSSEFFWLMLEAIPLQRYLQKILQKQCTMKISSTELARLARIFAQIVDTKSPFTLQHSQGVARVAHFLGLKLNLSLEQLEKLEIAALLHDLGKLQVPDEILDKPGPLSQEERILIRKHSFYTYQILRQIDGIEEIALWAAYHHEMINGQGYPFRKHGKQLGLETRILAVADILQAIAQDRPYRKGMSHAKIRSLLQDLVQQNHLDAQVVKIALEYFEPVVALAIAE